jgi:hypothetical protein
MGTLSGKGAAKLYLHYHVVPTMAGGALVVTTLIGWPPDRSFFGLVHESPWARLEE